MVNTGGESRHHHLIAHLRGKAFPLSPLLAVCMHVSCRFLVDTLWWVEEVPFSYQFAGSIYHE